MQVSKQTNRTNSAFFTFSFSIFCDVIKETESSGSVRAYCNDT